MKVLLLSFMLLANLISCQSKEKNTQHQHHTNEGSEVNQHMHEVPTAELIKRFESPERDEYQKPALVLDYIGDINGQNIMDLGAGSGYFAVKMAKRGAHVIAADVNDEFLDYINDRIANENIDSKSIETRKIPFDSPKLEAQEVDKVLIVNTYHHIENRTEYFKKVYNGLKKDGQLIVVDFFKKDLPIGPKTSEKFTEQEVMQELHDAGFLKFVRKSDLLPMQYIIIAKKGE